MTRSILLHIGMHKCGSTYLQQVLLRNRAALAAAGIAYPHDGSGHPGNAAGIESASARRLAALFGPHERLALSFEDLITSGPRARPFARAAAEIGAEVHLIAFIRPFSEIIFGDYSQMMKQHHRAYIEAGAAYGGKGFEQFVVARARQMTPRGWLRGWRNVLPQARFTLASHRAIRATVEPLLAPAALDWEVPRHLTNPSLRTEDCDRIAAMIESGAAGAGQIVEAVKTALHRPSQPDAGRTPERVAWIEAVFEHHNAALQEEFGYDNRLPAPRVTPSHGTAERVA
ncbi:hypothetical protein [Vannielia litorea]|uniref:Sulfotransferase family protein n=1 Tax=Vannielia litorea TaxID=1217970 RepID=A0A1N6HMJ3_9RHOB|nr:hypothetical protein [Vannielia litorea]SIO21078.1 hypothetical protein SAMN05444002_3526 [Vannielia litorea]